MIYVQPCCRTTLNILGTYPQTICSFKLFLKNTVQGCRKFGFLTFLSWHRGSVTVVSSSRKLRSLPWPNDSPSSRTKLMRKTERFILEQYHLELQNIICSSQQCMCTCAMYLGSVQMGGLDWMISLLISSFSRSPPARHHRWYTSSIARSDR